MPPARSLHLRWPSLSLEKGWLTIALALMSLGTAWISLKRPIRPACALAILAGIVVLRTGHEPRIVGSDLGTTPIFNWLLLGYGIPAASFWLGAHFLRKRGDDGPLRSLEAAAILFTVLLAFTEIRHYINNGDIYRRSSDLIEIGLQVCVALAMAIGLERLRIRTGSVIHNLGALLLTWFAGLAILFGLFFIANPAIWSIRIEGTFINPLILGYAIPAVLALLLSYAVAGRAAAYTNTIAAGALVLALAWITLEIRRLYHGPLMNSFNTFDAEQYTYSVAWLVFGVILLAIGLLLPSQRARLASAVMIGITVLKVFLIDMSNLTGPIVRSRSLVWASYWSRSDGCISASFSGKRKRRRLSRRRDRNSLREELLACGAAQLKRRFAARGDRLDLGTRRRIRRLGHARRTQRTGREIDCARKTRALPCLRKSQ
jgi:uncharacterized membrane protein